MEAVVGAANWLLGKVVTKLSDGLVAAYVDSLELGHNSQQIKNKLTYVQALLQVAQLKDVSNIPALKDLLADLSKKADEAEDALDELHYFKIQDQLDGTDEATTQEPAQEMGDVVRAHARHTRHAARYTVGNCLRCFSCSPTQDDDCAAAHAASNPDNKSDNDNNGGHVDKLSFNRVAMSNKIKSVIDSIHSLCIDVSNLLGHIPINNTIVPLTRPQRGAISVQDKLYGRETIFKKTVDDIINRSETLSVLPIVGPGGIGKTTFTQHLYNDTMIKKHFTVRVWVCVSTNFDLTDLTKQILNCIPATEKEGSNTANELSKLQECIAQRLKSKRFLIVLDDIWKFESEEGWKTLLAPFTKGDTKGNMVVITTRFPKLAHVMKTIDPIELQGLESNDFFTFFEACIFCEQNKPGHYEDDLSSIAREIVNKLKGSPLAAKTVGRLLKKNISQEHWNRVLQKHEWLNQQNNDDIMPSLKISYNYLPFDLQKCFLYCALFPEDYWFKDLEIYRFWIAIGIIESSHPVDRNYLEELVDNGFLMKGDNDGDQYYVMHDLMHELCQIVSAEECLNISNLDFRADALPQSIRHLSITVENRYDQKFMEQMGELKRRIDIANLRTLMIFRRYEEGMIGILKRYEERMIGILKDTFEEINGLRVLFIDVELIEAHNFSKLIHLRYLKIGTPNDGREIALPSTLSRFYHLKFLDLKSWWGSCSLPKDFSRLVNLRDFIAQEKLHSNVPEVGKMKYLQELKQFCVKKKSDGFELRELGKLGELAGELSIHNLENVATNAEASNAKLMLKSNLKKLRLVWGREQPTINADVLDGLQPHPNLRALVIENHGGTTGPSWLCLDIRVKSLETLHLEGVSWGTFPPFGQLSHLKELVIKNHGGTTGPSWLCLDMRLKSLETLRLEGVSWGTLPPFGQLPRLKELRLASIPELVEWVVEPNCHSSPRLKSIECRKCPNLRVMPFSEYCTNLCSLEIYDCPKLSLPPMPHTSTQRKIVVKENDNERLLFEYDGKSLYVESDYNGDLAFHNMNEVEHLTIAYISLLDLEKLKSLRILNVERCDKMFSEEVDSSVVFSSVESLGIGDSHLTEELLSKMLNCFPALSEFTIGHPYSKFEDDEDDEEQVIRFPSSSSLQRVRIISRESLVLVPAEDGGGIQRGISSLHQLKISYCGEIFSRWPMGGAQNVKPFPSSLRKLLIHGEWSMQSMALLSNLTSLTHLTLTGCMNLTADGFDPLMAANLKQLRVLNWGSEHSIAADLLSEMARSITRMPPFDPDLLSGSFQLEQLQVDSISGVLVAPVCSLLAASLHELEFCYDDLAESFTEEQEKALQLLTSLQQLQFSYCKRLQSLPQGLHRLSSLKGLRVKYCEKIRCLPKDGFPTSLETLFVSRCSAELNWQVEKLKATNPNLRHTSEMAHYSLHVAGAWDTQRT